ncbi:MAG TPA: hypothetical protein VK824_06020 [Planctomycetota bacterium]|nr:hypothetical protein [Planctomycetota bacterium]
MPSRAQTIAEPGAPGGQRLSWTVHPAAAQPLRAAALLAVIALASALAFSVSGAALPAIVAAVLLAGSLRAWFLPRTYVLDEQGAAERGPMQAGRRLAWSEVRAVSRERHGIHLSPLHGASRRVPDRGLFLRTDGDAAIAERAQAFLRRQRGA